MSGQLLKGIIVVVLAVCLAVLLLSLSVEESHPQKTGIATCLDHEMQDRVRRLMTRSFDQAFMQQTAQLFDIWVTDYSAEPPRAINGMKSNISAYARAQAAAENWTFPAC